MLKGKEGLQAYDFPEQKDILSPYEISSTLYVRPIFLHEVALDGILEDEVC